MREGEGGGGGRGTVMKHPTEQGQNVFSLVCPGATLLDSRAIKPLAILPSD
jgi:hypothetical protein